MFDEKVQSEVADSYKQGKRPSQILREVALLHPETSVPELMKLMRDVFSLSYTAVQCIGGWWHDGTGELTDAELDLFLVPEIEKVIYDRANPAITDGSQ